MIADCSLHCPRCGARVVHGLDCGCEPVTGPMHLAEMLDDVEAMMRADEDRTEAGGERDPEPRDIYGFEEDDHAID